MQKLYTCQLLFEAMNIWGQSTFQFIISHLVSKSLMNISSIKRFNAKLESWKGIIYPKYLLWHECLSYRNQCIAPNYNRRERKMMLSTQGLFPKTSIIICQEAKLSAWWKKKVFEQEKYLFERNNCKVLLITLMGSGL